MLRSFLAAVLCFSCATPAIRAPEALQKQQPLRITIVGTNDWHGWVAPQSEKFPQGEIRQGGAALFSAYLKVLRAQNPDGVVLLDGGDMFQGTLLSNSTEGAVVIKAFNLLGYDAVAIGNHEFDYGPVGPVSVAGNAQLDPFGALKARIAEAKFPVLSANTYDKETGNHPAWLGGDGTVLIERHGVKIGIIGLTTTQTPSTTVPVNVKSLRFADLAQEALAASNRLRKKGADVVVVAAHAGGKCDEKTHGADTASCDLDVAEIFKMITALPAGAVDAVVSGHTHSFLGHIVNGVPVIQSWAMGRYFGLIELTIDPQTRKVLPALTTIDPAVPLCETVDETSQNCDTKALLKRPETVRVQPAKFRGQVVAPDPIMVEMLKPLLANTEALQNKLLGVTVPETLWRNYDGESVLGSLLADNVRDMEKADVVLLNSGGLRADLKKGPLTYGAVYEVLPFDNGIARIELSGAQLTAFLNMAYASKRGVFQMSGAEIELSKCAAPKRIRSLKVAGKPVVDTGKYLMVLPDFLARGGDGLGPAFAMLDSKQIDLGESREKNLREALLDHWQKKPPQLSAPKLGRIRIIAEATPCAAGE